MRGGLGNGQALAATADFDDVGVAEQTFGNFAGAVSRVVVDDIDVAALHAGPHG